MFAIAKYDIPSASLYTTFNIDIISAEFLVCTMSSPGHVKIGKKSNQCMGYNNNEVSVLSLKQNQKCINGIYTEVTIFLI